MSRLVHRTDDKEIVFARWEESGTHANACVGASELFWLHEHQSQGTLLDGSVDLKDQGAPMLYEAVVGLMQRARPAVIDEKQFLALPDTQQLSEFKPCGHMAFPTIYVSVGLHPWGSQLLAGVLIAEGTSASDGIWEVHETDEEKAAMWSFLQGKREDLPMASFTENPQHILCAFVGNPADPARRDPSRVLPALLYDTSTSTYADLTRQFVRESMDKDLHETALATLLYDSLNVIQFLESANVEVVEASVTRQVRRQVERKGLQIGNVVRVKPRKTRSRPLVTGGELTTQRDFTHRFEVAAHYAHFPEDTKLFRATLRDAPEKILQNSTFGRHVRIFQPAHVKGPEHLPLIPKTRNYG